MHMAKLNYLRHIDDIDELDVPTEEQLESPEFKELTKLTMNWDVSTNGDAFCPFNANHIATILNVINRSNNGN